MKNYTFTKKGGLDTGRYRQYREVEDKENGIRISEAIMREPIYPTFVYEEAGLKFHFGMIDVFEQCGPSLKSNPFLGLRKVGCYIIENSVKAGIILAGRAPSQFVRDLGGRVEGSGGDDVRTRSPELPPQITSDEYKELKVKLASAAKVAFWELFTEPPPEIADDVWTEFVNKLEDVPERHRDTFRQLIRENTKN
jgi:hypothetical protein